MLRPLLNQLSRPNDVRRCFTRQLFLIGRPIVDGHEDSSYENKSNTKSFSSTSTSTFVDELQLPYFPNRFKDKVAIITGSTAGFGKSIAKRLYLEGANVVICSRRQEHVDDAVRDIIGSCSRLLPMTERTNSISGIVCHVGKDDDRRRLVDFTLEKYGKINCFLPNAGVNPHVGPVESINEEQLDKLFDINFKSTVMLMKLVLPHLKQKPLQTTNEENSITIDGRGSSVVFMSTAAGPVGQTSIACYAASKMTLFTLTKALAQEHANDNIRFNCIAPGPFDTKFGNVLKCRDKFGGMQNSLIQRRFGMNHELDGLAAYLLSEEASYVNGEIISVTGGMQSR